MPLDDVETDELICIERELCASSLYTFAKEAYPILEPNREFVPGWHIQAICEHLEACVSGQIKNLVINMPPRHMKSLLVSVLFPSWLWITFPERRFLMSSYAASLSIRDSMKTRRIIQSDWYQSRFGDLYQISTDQNEKSKFENDKTGYRMATSVGGRGTGEGGDYIVVDDPHKVRESESKVMRENVIKWWDEEMSSRGNDPNTVVKIVVMQRVHENDLSGHVLGQGGYEHLCLPAEFEPKRVFLKSCIGWKDPRTKEGELLWPARFTTKALDEMKLRMGSTVSAGQLQQRPAPDEGIIFKRKWFKFYTAQPAVDKISLSADLTFKEGTANDYAVLQVWGKKGADKYLLDQVRARMGFNAQIMALKGLVAKWPDIQEKWIEQAANAEALLDVLKSKIHGIILVPARTSKRARAEAVSPQFESGNIYLPDPTIAPWISDYIEELAVFDNGLHDDQVDASSLGIIKLSEGISDDWLPISMTAPSKWLK
jgi:predicted phage terminase large subunit-like protein